MNAPLAKKQPWVAVTVILTVLIAASIAMALAKPSQDPIEELKRPALTTTVAQEQFLRVAAASDGGWWARLRSWVVDVPVNPLETAVESYGRVLSLGKGAAPEKAALHARRAVALAELGRRPEAQAELTAAAALSPLGAKLAHVIAYALEVGSTADLPTAADRDEALAALVVPGTTGAGWTGDRIRLGFARRSGSPAESATEASALIKRVNQLTALECAAVLAGVLILLLALARRRAPFPPLAHATLPPPWTLSGAYAVSIRGTALALLAGGVVWAVMKTVGGVDGTGTGFIVAAVPVLLYVHRGLLVPHGLTWTGAFGLRPRAGWSPVLVATLLLLALQLVLALVTDLTAVSLGRRSPWTERAEEALLTGNAFEVSSMVAAMVACAPVVEETLFRGVLYGSLRTRLGVWPSALLSAALFSLAHGYSVIGAATIFLGALIWALAYESTRSLLPTVLDHAANNALAVASDLVLR